MRTKEFFVALSLLIAGPALAIDLPEYDLEGFCVWMQQNKGKPRSQCQQDQLRMRAEISAFWARVPEKKQKQCAEVIDMMEEVPPSYLSLGICLTDNSIK